MDFLKKNLKFLAFMLVAIFIGGGAYYYGFILSPQIEELQSLKEQNEIKTLELQYLEQEYHRLPERRKELIDMEMQVQALKDKVPSSNISVMMMEIIQYMKIANFEDTQVSMGEPVKQENGQNSYYTTPITLEYTTTYDNTIRFLEEINRSYQRITVDYFAIDNSVQEETDQITPGDLVKTDLVLILYYKDSKDKEEYPNFMEYFNQEENVFLRHGADELDGSIPELSSNG